MTGRMITMNVDTHEISFTDLTAQELAELRAITDDYHRRFGSPHRSQKPMQRDQTMDREKAASRMVRV